MAEFLDARFIIQRFELRFDKGEHHRRRRRRKLPVEVDNRSKSFRILKHEAELEKDEEILLFLLTYPKVSEEHGTSFVVSTFDVVPKL